MNEIDAANHGGGAGTNGPPTKPKKRWMSVTEVATASGRHRESVLRALQKGLLDGVQPGPNRQWRIDEEIYDAWAERGAPVPSAIPA